MECALLYVVQESLYALSPRCPDEQSVEMKGADSDGVLSEETLRSRKHFVLDGSYDVVERGLLWVVSMAEMGR